tara:strand:+ start:145 stop:366 length:222 start_codon:yes stop_codon:yes gene_type:complete
MAQNKLKQKVEGLTKIVKGLLQEVRANTDLAQGTLTAFQLHIGKEEWEKVVQELKNIEERRTKEKKLDLNVEE